MWSDEAGYTVNQNSTTFELIANWEEDYVRVAWTKDTGIFTFYEVDHIREDGIREHIVAAIVRADITTPTSSETDTGDSPGISFGYTSYFTLPFLAVASIVIRRRRK
ncbi:MAG: hypothetical protein ACXAB7_01630 [Candidatus Kariarchaeaceae archaeon]|jgi:hypothetical protein